MRRVCAALMCPGRKRSNKVKEDAKVMDKESQDLSTSIGVVEVIESIVKTSMVVSNDLPPNGVSVNPKSPKSWAENVEEEEGLTNAEATARVDSAKASMKAQRTWSEVLMGNRSQGNGMTLSYIP